MRLLRIWAWFSSAVAAGGACALLAASSALSQSEGFYRGKVVTIYVGGTAGSGVDEAARLVAHYLGKYLLGDPTVIVQDMPGAGGIRLIDYLHASALRDGAVLGTLPSGSMLEPLIGVRKANYDMNEFAAIGAMDKDVSLCISSTHSSFKTIEDAEARQMVVAGTGAGADPDVFPVVLNQIIGTKFKLITGYLGTQETSMAIERHEVDGRCGWSWASIKTTRPAWVRDKKINYLLQLTLHKSPEFPDVPSIMDLIKDQGDRQMMTALLAPLTLSRPFLAPPGLPPERVAELRKAFLAALADSDLRADAAKISEGSLDPTSGEEMQEQLAGIYATPAAIVDRLRTILAH